jgi:PAS domain S-box-containing protein
MSVHAAYDALIRVGVPVSDTNVPSKPIRNDRHDLQSAIHAPHYQPLEKLLDAGPWNVPDFLKLAIGMTGELVQLHAAGHIHGNLTPLEFAIDPHTGETTLHWDHDPQQFKDELSTGPITQHNLPYLSPERIARWNQKTDGRSDLYSLGIIFYQMLTGSLPFAASDELGWFHSHLARTPIFSEDWATRIPALLQRVILKLLAKDRNDRYQSASGLLYDLKYCLKHQHEADAEFSLGKHDIPNRMEISHRIYGRSQEKERLLQTFERVIRRGQTELFLVFGYAGVGKTALVNELHEPVTRKGGFFITGKFDQLNRGIPYYTHAQAFQGLISQILGESETRISLWRQRLLEALGQQAQVIINVIPKLEIIIGKQPDVPELPPLETQNRFHSLFQKFVSVFAAPHHPLVIFLDDLQWADAASLKLLEYLTTNPNAHHLLFIGASRRSELGPTHPLEVSLAAIRKAHGRVHELEVSPLEPDQLQNFLADTLFTAPEKVAPLAALLHQKTAGNPFFFIQYVKALAEEKLIMLNPISMEWSWDMEAIQARSYTDNVAEFMLARLRKLPASTQKLLQAAACLGSKGKIRDLERLLENGNGTLTSLNRTQLEGILRFNHYVYYFLHDRVQQAAYALLSGDEQKEWHLRIARLFGKLKTTEDDYLFDRMSHYRNAQDLLEDLAEKREVAHLSLMASLKAKASAANKSALDYSIFGLNLLPDSTWSDDYQLMLELHMARAECMWRSGDSAGAEDYFNQLLGIANLDDLDRMRVYRILIEVNTTQGKMEQALVQCHRGLAVIDKDFPVAPTDADVQDVYAAFRRDLGQRPIASLMDLPPITDPLEKAALDTMAAAIPAAIFTSLNMGSYLYCKMVCCSLAYGNSDASASAYAYFAMILGSVFGEYQEAYQLGKVAYDLAQRDAHTWKARIFVIFGNVVNHWTKPMRSNIPYVRAALPAASEVGDLAGACYSCNHLISTLLAVGQPLSEVYAETEKALKFVLTMNYPSIADIIIGQQRLVLALQGKTRLYSGITADTFDEEAYANRICSSQMALLKFWYHTWRLQASYLFDRQDEALAAAEVARSLAWSSPGHVEEAEHHFYHALTLARACTEQSASHHDQWLQELIACRDRFALWARNSPDNFSHKHQLIEAELLRLTRDDLAAMRCYENAIRLAQQNGFIQDEALSYELAARYYEKAGFPHFAQQYNKEARRCYEAWGANGKVLQLDNRYPQLIPSPPLQELATRMIDIDMISLLRATQSISSEIVPAKLSETLIRLIVEASGADSGLLILSRQGELFIEAEARTSTTGLQIHVMNSIPARDFLQAPHAVLNFVQRTQQKVIIANAQDPHAFSHDEYLRTIKPRSLLCVPIVKNKELVGLIYLENKFVAGTFTEDKLTALEILASQAAVSVENARLYTDLSREEEKLRTTIESMADGLLVADPRAGVSLINEAALRIVGLNSSQDQLLRDRLQMTERMDFRDADDIRVPFDQLPLTRALRGETLNQLEYHIRNLSTGRPLILRVSASPLSNQAGTIQGAVVVIRDVTELTELDRLKDEFLRAMAHELKTPLLVVAGYFEMYKILVEKGAAPATLQECMGRIETGISRLKSLMSTLVDVAVFQLHKLKLRLEEIDLRALGKELLDSMADTAPKHQLSFVSTSSGPILIQGDRVRLTQVLNNFLQNAIKYSPQGGTVKLEIHEEADSVVVSIMDQGIGIPEDRQDRLFQRFYRAHAETENDYGGMGVGLFISQEIIQAHHGQIWFSSEQGVGSQFSFRLPKRQAAH